MYKVQISRFLLVGLSTVLIDYIVYISLINILGFSPVFKAISFVVGASYAFIFNSLYTFGQRKFDFYQLLKFILTYIVSLGVNTGVNSFFLSNFFTPFDLSISLTFCLATLASSVINFLGMKFFVYR